MTGAAVRYHALDRVRALAMLLGVAYHAILFRMLAGGGPMGPMGLPPASQWLADWLHSFRMPLFFLISGFFGRMTLRKYGAAEFLRRRWARIGLPLLVGMFTFGPAYVLTRDLTSTMPRFGPGPGGPPGPGGFAEMPPPPPGFVPPPLRRFDEDGDGSLGASEWKLALAELSKMTGPGGPPGGPTSGGLAVRLFGPYERFVQLNHLWFLWYLLVFVTAAPLATRALDLAARRTPLGRLGPGLIRRGLAPAALAVAGTPALLATASMSGWFLGLAPAIFRAFPDFALHLDPDMAFYFLDFLAGWWLHRDRDALPSLAGTWAQNAAVGLAAFVAAMALAGADSRGPSTPGRALARVAAYAIYCLGSASTSFALVGLFLRHFDRPSRTWRYLADTALWVYLVHQPLVLIGLALCRPYPLPWWAQTTLVTTFSVGVALLLYEAIVRRTPLVRLFGPGGLSRPAAAGGAGVEPPGLMSAGAIAQPSETLEVH